MRDGVIRLSREFSFEMAHSLEGYDGACREIHGHSYRLAVTVSGRPQADETSPKLGMVVDFGLLKRIVNERIVSRYDHAFVVRRTPSNGALIEALQAKYANLRVVDYQPTSENLLLAFVDELQQALPDGVRLEAVRLSETASSSAEWLRSDNL